MERTHLGRRPIVGIMGPGKQAAPLIQQWAYELGQLVAAQGWIVLTGGRAEGVMEAASRGAKSMGGLTIGILPSEDDRSLSAAVDIPIVTGMGSARNNINVLSSWVVIACGLGAGTTSEIALALKANKPVIVLNENTPTAHLSQQFFQYLGGDRLKVAHTPAEALTIAKQWIEPAV